MRYTLQVHGCSLTEAGQIVLDIGEHYISLYLVRGSLRRLLTQIAVLKAAEVIPSHLLESIAA